QARYKVSSSARQGLSPSAGIRHGIPRGLGPHVRVRSGRAAASAQPIDRTTPGSAVPTSQLAPSCSAPDTKRRRPLSMPDRAAARRALPNSSGLAPTDTSRHLLVGVNLASPTRSSWRRAYFRLPGGQTARGQTDHASLGKRPFLKEE